MCFSFYCSSPCKTIKKCIGMNFCLKFVASEELIHNTYHKYLITMNYAIIQHSLPKAECAIIKQVALHETVIQKCWKEGSLGVLIKSSINNQFVKRITRKVRSSFPSVAHSQPAELKKTALLREKSESFRGTGANFFPKRDVNEERWVALTLGTRQKLGAINLYRRRDTPPWALDTLLIRGWLRLKIEKGRGAGTARTKGTGRETVFDVGNFTVLLRINTKIHRDEWRPYLKQGRQTLPFPK